MMAAVLAQRNKVIQSKRSSASLDQPIAPAPTPAPAPAPAPTPAPAKPAPSPKAVEHAAPAPKQSFAAPKQAAAAPPAARGPESPRGGALSAELAQLKEEIL